MSSTKGEPDNQQADLGARLAKTRQCPEHACAGSCMEKERLQANSQQEVPKRWESFEDTYSEEGQVEQEW